MKYVKSLAVNKEFNSSYHTLSVFNNSDFQFFANDEGIVRVMGVLLM